MQDFSDKAVLVTGSTRGIGNAIARALALRGATVGIHGRSLETSTQAAEELTNEGLKAIPLAADLSDPNESGHLVKAFHEKAGSLDGLVNNAGGGKAVAFRGIKLEAWQETFRTNLDAAMIASQAAYNLMRKQKQGAIVNITSISAHGPGKWMGADYAASKAALVSLTKTLAFEAARINVRVNAISPGFVETDMTAPLTDKMRENLNIPMKRLAQPSEVAEAACFLLSNDSSYITGQVLHVDGGLFM